MRCTCAAVDNQTLKVVDADMKIQTSTEEALWVCGRKTVREGMLTLTESTRIW